MQNATHTQLTALRGAMLALKFIAPASGFIFLCVAIRHQYHISHVQKTLRLEGVVKWGRNHFAASWALRLVIQFDTNFLATVVFVFAICSCLGLVIYARFESSYWESWKAGKGNTKCSGNNYVCHTKVASSHHDLLLLAVRLIWIWYCNDPLYSSINRRTASFVSLERKDSLDSWRHMSKSVLLFESRSVFEFLKNSRSRFLTCLNFSARNSFTSMSLLTAIK